MRYFIFLVLWAATAWAAEPISVPTAPGAPVSASGPKIQFDALVYNFGKVQSGELVKHNFFFTNTGSQCLILSNVVGQCHCTTATDWTRQVEPGKSGVISAQFNTAGYSALDIIKVVTVTCNGKDQSLIHLQLRGAVWRPIEYNTWVMLSLQPDAACASNVVRIVNNQEQPLTLSAPVCPNPAFGMQLRTNRPGKEFLLVITNTAPAPAGNAQAQITMKTSATNEPIISINAMLYVAPPIAVSPAKLILSPPPWPSNQVFTITVVNNSTNLMTLTEPSFSKPGVDVQIREMQRGRYCQVILTFPKGFELPPGQGALLTLKTSNPKCPAISVPVDQQARMVRVGAPRHVRSIPLPAAH